MKYRIFIQVYLLFLTYLLKTVKCAVNTVGINNEIVKIFGVSTSISQLNYAPKGSIQGGTQVYVTCTNHDMVASNNSIKIGPYPCIIPEKGVGSNTITCITTEAFDPLRRWNQPVELFVRDKSQATCESRSCVFHYDQNATPFLKYIQPSVSVPDRDVSWTGLYRVSNTIDIKKLIIKNDKNGEFNCNRFQIQDVIGEKPLNLNDDQNINANYYEDVLCTVSEEQVGGLYEAIIESRWGTPMNLSTNKMVTIDGQKQYQFVLTPEILSVNQNSGGNLGNIIEIQGLGFGNDKNSVNVDVGGLNCQVLQVNNEKLSCQIEKGDTYTSKNSYIKGQGLRKTVYNMNNNYNNLPNVSQSASALFTYVQNNQQQDRIVSDEQYGNWEISSLDSYHGVHMRGYFYAPRSGNYVFWTTGDDHINVYLNQNPDTSSVTESDLINKRTSHSNRRNYFYPNASGYKSEEIQLNEGQYYWLEVIGYNGGSAGHIAVSVEAPENDEATILSNTQNEIVQYKIIPEKQNQIWSLMVWNDQTAFGLKFYKQDAQTREVLLNASTSQLPWDQWTDEMLQSQINSTVGFQPVVKGYALDKNGLKCTTVDGTQDGDVDPNCDISGRLWLIEFTQYRTGDKSVAPQLTKQIQNSSLQLFQQQYQNVIGGYYNMAINGVLLEVYVNNQWTDKIPYNANASHIKQGITRIFDEQSIEAYTQGSANTGYTIVINFKSEKSSLRGDIDIVFDNYLEGQKPGSVPQIIQSDLQTASLRPFYEPIPFDMSFQESDKPSVLVSVNGVLSSVKLGVDNSYETNSNLNPIISSFSYENSVLTFDMSNSVDQSFQVEDIKINFGGSECNNINISSLSAVTCDLVDNIEGGNHKPQVYVQGFGFSDVSTLEDYNVQVIITSVSPSTGGIQGGIDITIQGEGFVNISNIKNVKVMFGTAVADIVSCSSTEIIVNLPATSDDYSTPVQIQVIVNEEISQVGNNDFQYSDENLPTVSNISPSFASPVMKGTITIDGSNFGSVKEDIKVKLFKEVQQEIEGVQTVIKELAYDLIIQTVSDTQIEATLSGGHVGIYKLVVQRAVYGYSIQDIEFSYRIEIHSVSPVTGGINGGTILTITGQNFSNSVSDNNVFITQGDEMINDQCVVISATNQEITCTMPPKNAEFNGPLDIFVQGRLIEESICTTQNCQFTYVQEQTPQINQNQSFNNVKYGDKIDIQGSLLDTSNQINFIFNDVQRTTIQGVSESEGLISFEVPIIDADNYEILVQLSDKGYAGVFNLEIQVQIENSIQIQRNISKGGENLVINGQGFSVDNSEILVNGKKCIITEAVTLTQIKCRSYGADNNQNLSINYKNTITNESQTQTISNIKHSNEFTPIITQIDPVKDSEIKIQNTFDINILQSTGLDQGNVSSFLSHYLDYNIQYQGSINDDKNVISFVDVPLGTYNLNVYVEGLGFALLSDNLYQIKITVQNDYHFNIPNIETSLTGGNLLNINGIGFDTQNLVNNNILVCGYECQIQDTSSYDSLQCILPQVNTVYLKNDQLMNTKPEVNQIISKSLFGPPVVINQGNSNEQKVQATAFADNADKAYMIADNDILLSYQSSGGTECYIGYDYGENLRFQVDSISYTTKPQGDSQSSKLIGGKFQGSNDGENYEDIYTLGNDFNQGSSTWVSEDVTQIYRYIRFYNSVESGSAYCGFTDLQMKGWNYYKEEITTESDFSCDVIIDINGEQSVVEDAVNYKANVTPIVSSINPNYGWQLGGTEVTISGDKFGNAIDQAYVTIDGIECTVSSVTENEIICTTGNKGADNCDQQGLFVSINNYKAVVPDHVKFYYGLLWSQDATWGLEIAPREGDSVYVGKCKTLIVDQDTPKYIFSIVVEYGTIFFADNGDRQFHAQYFIVRKGNLIIGSQEVPHTSNLTITLYGNYWDKQLPDYGVKVIACYKCKLDIHGSPKLPTWSSLKATVNINDNNLQLIDKTNWQIGDQIAIATTSFDGRDSEDVFITDITHQEEGDLIEFSPSLKNKHISEIEEYDGKQLKMQAEVGNLSRNIVIQGNPEDDVEERFGGQLMLHGKGAEGRIEYTEFRYVGQPRIIGRYTMHFHMVGDCKYSYIRGNAVHKSYARVVALHDISHLRVQHNVGYMVKGHNIFLENGIETHNIIEYNLLISPRSVFNMLQTDITVAGIWATNPKNYVRYNHVAGSQFYGLWYEIFDRPESPHVTNDICPIGLPVLQLEHNIAHSNQRFGLRFFRLQPRTYPCQPVRNDNHEDPWLANPSIQTTFSNHTLYKNGESGILAEEMGNSIFTDSILADNYHAGFQAHLTNFTREEVIFENSIVVGRSQTNAHSIEFHKNAKSTAILGSRTDGFRVRNVKIYNFDEGTSVLKVSSQNNFSKLFVQGGKTTYVEQLQINNCDNAKRVQWLGPRKNIIIDEDGSLSGTNKITYIAPYEKHLNQAVKDGGCLYDENIKNLYDNSIVCSNIKLRTIQIGNLQEKKKFDQQFQRIFNLNDNELCFNNTGGCQEQLSDFTNYQNKMILNEAKDGSGQYSTVFAEGYSYNIHWNSRLDWSTLLVYLPQIYDLNDKTMILRFNFTEQRELFDVYNFKQKKIVDLYSQSSQLERFYDPVTNLPNSSDDGCRLGEYYIDYEFRTVSLCVNNKGRETPYQSVQMNGVYCRHTCPVYGFDCEKEQGNLRQFSEITQWQDVAMRKRPEEEDFVFGAPQNGDDVIIPCEWTMVFNVAEFTFGTLIIDGTLKIDSNIPSTTIKANNIWIRSGKLIAGDTEQFPYKSQLHIELYGNRYSPPIIIDDFSRTGTKSLAVTGQLILYGQIPETTQSRLAVSVNVGENIIIVHKNTDISGWKQGDEIILGGSQLNGKGYEKNTIQSINGQSITLQQPIQYYHYGAEFKSIGNNANNEEAYVYIDESYGSGVDMRTVIGHITRNIRITATDEDETGGHLQVYHWKFYEKTDKQTTDIDVRGNIVLSGVELENMGQINSENAGIHIISTNAVEGEKTIIKGSSIHDCLGMCLNFVQTNNILVQNNVIYNGEQFLIASYGYKNQEISNNLLVGARSNKYQTGGEPATFIYMYESYDPATSNILVTGNVGQSSESLGFAFPSLDCDKKDSSKFYNNETGNTKDVGIIYNMKQNGCRYGGNNAIYHSLEGISVHSAGTTSIGWLLQKHIIIECGTGIIMRSGNNNARTHYNELRNTYVSAMLLDESCPQCYNSQNCGKHFRCNNQFGAQLLLTNMVGNACPLTLGALALKALCNVPTAFSQMYIYDTEFVNYRKVYDQFDYPHLPQDNECQNNKVFKTNSIAAEATAAHYLINVKCTNCHRDGMFKLDEPKEKWRGWFGGCGIMDCTGLENVMVQDLTGDFLGIEGTVISNNEDVGYGGNMRDSCRFVTEWNGFNCTRTDISVLEWESIGPDAKTISTAPVSVTNDQFTNYVNMWREWEWLGPEPQNRRQNTFTSLILANQVHNITYAGQKSFNLLHKMSHRSPVGEPDRFVIIKYHYSNPLTIEVLVNGEQVKTFPFKAPENLMDHTTVCGANNYFFQNSTVHFVITNEPSCQVQVRLRNHVQINMRIGMSKEEFYSDDAHQTTFINRIQAFLNIPHDRIRIVGIVDKSQNDNNRILLVDKSQDFRELQFIIVGNEPGTEETQYDKNGEFVQLKEYADKIIQSVQEQSIDIGIGQYYGAEYNVVVAKEAGKGESSEDYVTEYDISKQEEKESQIRSQDKNEQQEQQEKKSNFIIVSLGILFGIIFIIVVALILYHIWKKQQLMKVQRKTVPQDSEVYSEQNLDIKQLSQLKGANINSSNNINKTNADGVSTINYEDNQFNTDNISVLQTQQKENKNLQQSQTNE